MYDITNTTEQIIQQILTEMHDMFINAVGPRSRSEYMASIGVSGIDYSFSLSVEEIIKNKIPAPVMGCTGRAKVFCELAKRRGINAYVICTAKYNDWLAVRNHQPHPTIISGHQINAVEIDGVLRVFDAGCPNLGFISTDLKAGNLIDAIGDGKFEYMVCAVVPWHEFKQVNTYQKLRNLYSSGNMDNNQFTIQPNLTCV